MATLAQMAKKTTRRRPQPLITASREPTNDWLAVAVKAELERRELSISELAAATRLNRVQLSYWLSGQRYLRSDAVGVVLQHLGFKVTAPKG
jgi:hypothetical protein